MTSQEFTLLIGALKLSVAFRISLFGHHVMIIMNVLREVQLSYLLREKSGPYVVTTYGPDIVVVGKLIVRGLSTAAKFLFSLVAYRYNHSSVVSLLH